MALPTLEQDIALVFEARGAADFVQLTPADHGRIGTRRIGCSSALNVGLDFPHVGQVLLIKRESIKKKPAITPTPLQPLFLDHFQCAILLVYPHDFSFVHSSTKSLQDQLTQSVSLPVPPNSPYNPSTRNRCKRLWKMRGLLPFKLLSIQ